jgi:hypothetical protein
MLQHVSGQPNLTALPPADRPAVARALAKRPDDRFPSCLAFVQALMTSAADTAVPTASMNLRRARVDRSVAERGRAAGDDYPGDVSSVSGRADPTQPGRPPAPEPTQNFTLPGKPSPTIPGRPAGPLPALVTGTRPPTDRVPTPAPRTPMKSATPSPSPATDDLDVPMAEEMGPVVPVAALLGTDGGEPAIDPREFVAAVVRAAAAGNSVPQVPGDVGRLADGDWVCRFPSTVPATVVALKLEVLHDRWGMSLEQPDPTQLLMRLTAGRGFLGRKYGFEVNVLLPTDNRPLNELTVLARAFGTPDAKFAREAPELIEKVLLDVRAQLGNVPDRRQHPRVSCDLGLTLYPIHSDGSVDEAVAVTCRDVSLGGVGFTVPRSLKTKYVYAAFDGVPETAGRAILLRLIRVKTVAGERHYGAQFRTDLG